MLPGLRIARSIYIGIARISVVALLALVLLAGLIPSGALSASHACRMDCCTGKPPHEAGACNAFPQSAEKDETTPPQADADEHSSHQDEMQMSGAAAETVTETTVSSGHCQTAKHSSAQPHTPRRESLKHSSIAAQAFTRPCAPACAAAVLSLTQLRKPREAATVSIAVRPRPPTLCFRADGSIDLSTSSTELRRRIRPRAPPAMPVNHFA